MHTVGWDSMIEGLYKLIDPRLTEEKKTTVIIHAITILVKKALKMTGLRSHWNWTEAGNAVENVLAGEPLDAKSLRRLEAENLSIKSFIGLGDSSPMLPSDQVTANTY